MVTYTATTVPLQDLLLDPNNFRFIRPGQAATVSESRFAEDKVQAAALERIKSDGIAELKLSITENGFVPVERIVVREAIETSDGANTRYVVVEGNRRTGALKVLAQEHAGGVNLDAGVTSVFDAVPVLVASEASEDDILAIMGIRHVGGPKEWGGYQSALLVYRLMSQAGVTAREVASRLGLSVNEVNRRHRAFSALTQMLADEEYADLVTNEMYPIFHEIIGQPIVRDWLGWSQSDRVFTNDSRREQLYTWLTAGEDGPKIRSYSDIRELKQVLDNEDAMIALQDDDQTLSDAFAIVRAEAKSVRWLPNAKSALVSLNNMPAEVIDALNAEELDILLRLKNRAGRIIRANSLAVEPDEDEED